VQVTREVQEDLMNDNVPRGALMIVGVVFVIILLLWFLVLGVVQGRG